MEGEKKKNKKKQRKDKKCNNLWRTLLYHFQKIYIYTLFSCYQSEKRKKNESEIRVEYITHNSSNRTKKKK